MQWSRNVIQEWWGHGILRPEEASVIIKMCTYNWSQKGHKFQDNLPLFLGMKNAAFCLIGSSAYESTMTLLSPEILGKPGNVFCWIYAVE